MQLIEHNHYVGDQHDEYLQQHYATFISGYYNYTYLQQHPERRVRLYGDIYLLEQEYLRQVNSSWAGVEGVVDYVVGGGGWGWGGLVAAEVLYHGG